MTAAMLRQIEAATAIEKKENHMVLSSNSWFPTLGRERWNSEINADEGWLVPGGARVSTKKSCWFKKR